MLAETAENNANACASATITNPEAGDPVSVYNLSAQEDHKKILFHFLPFREKREPFKDNKRDGTKYTKSKNGAFTSEDEDKSGDEFS